jgi:hypothetical protein
MYLAQHCGGSDLHGDCLAAFRQVELGTIFTHPYGIYCEIEQVTVAVRRVVAALCDTLAPSLMNGRNARVVLSKHTVMATTVGSKQQTKDWSSLPRTSMHHLACNSCVQGRPSRRKCMENRSHQRSLCENQHSTCDTKY